MFELIVARTLPESVWSLFWYATRSNLNEFARRHTELVSWRISAGVDAATLIAPMTSVARIVLKEMAKSFIVGGMIYVGKNLVLPDLSFPAVV